MKLGSNKNGMSEQTVRDEASVNPRWRCRRKGQGYNSMSSVIQISSPEVSWSVQNSLEQRNLDRFTDIFAEQMLIFILFLQISPKNSLSKYA